MDWARYLVIAGQDSPGHGWGLQLASRLRIGFVWRPEFYETRGPDSGPTLKSPSSPLYFLMSGEGYDLVFLHFTTHLLLVSLAVYVFYKLVNWPHNLFCGPSYYISLLWRPVSLCLADFVPPGWGWGWGSGRAAQSSSIVLTPNGLDMR